jgi:DNA-binding winged helix-turn-helix (wHTH) protein
MMTVAAGLTPPSQTLNDRIAAVTSADERQNFYLDEILVSPQHNRVALGERSLRLQPKVMAVLAYLAQHQERVISAEELMDQLWKGRVVTPSSVQKSINSLRSTLAELAGEREFVAHFSKRGYQLVVPARFPEPQQASLTVPGKRSGRVAAWIAVCVLMTVAVFTGIRLWVPGVPVPEDKWPRLHVTEFRFSGGFTSDIGHERSAEPHPDGERVAYVRDTDGQEGLQSQILIRDREGRDWPLASADGSWVNLAWSPSGRNLVAVEMRRAEGLPPSPAYYEKPNYLYSFHIFTLDFSGRRLLEKNLLSQWQGAIESVTWWDENTLEFVASQGPDSASERYRYVIAEQQLSMLNPLDSGYSPQQNLVREKISAVLSRRGNKAQVEFLDPGQKRLAAWPVPSTHVEISWIPDGSGVLILEKDTAELYALYWDGSVTPVRLHRDQVLSLSYPRYRQNGQSLLVSAIAAKTHLQRIALDGQSQVLSSDAFYNSFPRFSADGETLVFASLRDGQQQIRSLRGEIEELLLTADKPVTRMIWPDGQDFLLYKSGRAIWVYSFSERTPRRLLERTAGADPLAYDPGSQQLWVTKQTGDARNIWLINLQSRLEKQLTFGAVASALAHDKGMYFQYRGQHGLWTLSDEGPQQVSANLPNNSQLLRVVSGGVYFVVGGPCRESAVQYLDLSTDTITIAAERIDNKVISHDFHPHQGTLQLRCELPESNILEWAADGREFRKSG